jgi:hypothetical protein
MYTRQRSPLSAIYVLAMNTLLHTLQQYNGGIRILEETKLAVAYMDDVTVFLNLRDKNTILSE